MVDARAALGREFELVSSPKASQYEGMQFHTEEALSYLCQTLEVSTNPHSFDAKVILASTLLPLLLAGKLVVLTLRPFPARAFLEHIGRPHGKGVSFSFPDPCGEVSTASL